MVFEQSSQPEPMAASSILTFHDSVELFLHAVCQEHKEINQATEHMNRGDLKNALNKITIAFAKVINDYEL